MNVVYHPNVYKVIEELSNIHSSRVIKVIDLFKDYQFRLHEAYLKKIARELWELRAGRYRLLFGMIDGIAVIVCIFMKKTQKTPRQMIDLAMRRLKEYEKK